MRVDSRLIALVCLMALGSTCQAQDSAQYEDSIEKARKKLFTPEGKLRASPSKVEPTRTLQNPFDAWHPPKGPTPEYEFHADVIATRRNLSYRKHGKDFYRTTDDLIKFFLSLPPPPVLPPDVSTVFVNPNTIPFYNALLQFLRAGPGPQGNGNLGSLLTVQQLQQITPSLLSLATIITPTSTGSQILGTPQGVAFILAAQAILQPLGMWNFPTLQAWANYITPRFGTLTGIVNILRQQLNNAGPIPITTITPRHSINILLIAKTIVDILKGGNKRRIAAEIPRLAHAATAHIGFTEPLITLYGLRGGNKTSIWPYGVSVSTELRHGGKRTVFNLNENGFFVNPYASGPEKFYQGTNDASLVYVPIELTINTVTTLDVVASNRYAALKKIVGGNARLLDRASFFSTALVSADVALLSDRSLHLRVVAASIPTTDMGGAAVRLNYGEEHLIGHVGLAAVTENKTENFIGYFETENVLRTPYFETTEKGTGVRTWASLTAMASVMAHKAMGSRLRTRKNRWGLQAEARFIPEIHMELATPLVNLRVTAGVTAGIVPGGHLNLDSPERTLGLYPIREHVELELKVLIAQEALFSILAVAEFSGLVEKGRVNVALRVKKFVFSCLLELESYRSTSFMDVRLGAGVAYQGIFVNYIHSLKDEDYRVEAGIDISSFWNDGNYYDD